jgi:hypothetical protein
MARNGRRLFSLDAMNDSIYTKNNKEGKSLSSDNQKVEK